jgi:hypothetical protein
MIHASDRAANVIGERTVSFLKRFCTMELIVPVAGSSSLLAILRRL